MLAAATAVKLRLEQRQQDADTARERKKDDERRLRDKDNKPKGERYKRDLGVPKDNADRSCGLDSKVSVNLANLSPLQHRLTHTPHGQENPQQKHPN